MRTTVRSRTFETNSSSVHAFVMLPDDFVAVWETRPTDWLDFGHLLDEVGAQGPADVTEPVIAREDCLISDREMWDRRNAKWDGQWIDEDEVVGDCELLPFSALSAPDEYSAISTSKIDGGTVYELWYDGWRD